MSICYVCNSTLESFDSFHLHKKDELCQPCLDSLYEYVWDMIDEVLSERKNLTEEEKEEVLELAVEQALEIQAIKSLFRKEFNGGYVRKSSYQKVLKKGIAIAISKYKKLNK